ncbi:hypothetical protein [Methanosarcina sp.]|uniref:hypothetical protein n=1 Tax=Methanosarcina sp. TaxID=2213 RepID=UPI003C778C2B
MLPLQVATFAASVLGTQDVSSLAFAPIFEDFRSIFGVLSVVRLVLESTPKVAAVESL